MKKLTRRRPLVAAAVVPLAIPGGNRLPLH